MMLRQMIFSSLAALALAVLFEIAYGTITRNCGSRVSKKPACTLYYCLIAIIWLLNANVLWITQAPALLGIGLSHCDLCSSGADPITWRAILRNILPSTRDAFRKLFESPNQKGSP